MKPIFSVYYFFHEGSTDEWFYDDLLTAMSKYETRIEEGKREDSDDVTVALTAHGIVRNVTELQLLNRHGFAAEQIVLLLWKK